MKICYLLLLHHKFDQAKRLIHRLANQNAYFVIHVDAKVDKVVFDKFKKDISSLNSLYFVKRVNVKWGAYSQAEAILNTIQYAVSNAEIKCDRFMLLSGQDYPIVSNKEIMSFISLHQKEEFLEANLLNLEDRETLGWTPFYRFLRYHYWLGKLRITLPFFYKKAPKIPIYHGATWWLITYAAAAYITKQFEHNNEWNAFLRTGFLTDEAYIPSVMMSSPFAENVTGYNVTYADWKNPTGPHPKTLGESDLDNMLQSKCLFARKLDMDIDNKIFDLLDLKEKL